MYHIKYKYSPSKLLQQTKRHITFELLKNLAADRIIHVYFFFALSHKGFMVAINIVHIYSFKSHLEGVV